MGEPMGSRKYKLTKLGSWQIFALNVIMVLVTWATNGSVTFVEILPYSILALAGMFGVQGLALTAERWNVNLGKGGKTP